jgi:Tfp pilus assembly protein PilF
MRSNYIDGTRFNKQNEFERAIVAFNRSLHHANNFHKNEVIAECYAGIAYAYFRLNQYRVAKYFYANALKLKPSDSNLTDSHLLCAIGNCYHFSGIIDSAQYYYEKAGELATTPNDECNVWNNWGLLKQQIGR